MKICHLLCFFALSCASFASQFIVTQSTVSAQNQKILSPGDVLLITGTVSTPVIVTASGTATNPITVKFADGARLSAPLWPITGAINANQKSFIVIDGGTNGVIENTANGTGMKNQKPSTGICITGSSNVEIKGLTIQNIYVHKSGSDVTDLDGCGSIYAQGLGGNVSIHDNTILHDHWLINLQAPYSNASGVFIANNNLGFCDHGIALGVSNVTVGSVSIISNAIHDYANWDTPTGRYHHDGIHIFTENGNVKTLRISGNNFSGATGMAMTSHVYLEADSVTGGFDDVQVVGNTVTQPTDGFGNFGAIAIGGAGSITNAFIQKNTITGNKTSDSYGVLISGAKNAVVVNSNNLYSVGTGVFNYSPTPLASVGANVIGVGPAVPPIVVAPSGAKITTTTISDDGKSITIMFDRAINK